MQHEATRPTHGVHVAAGWGLKIYVNRGHLIVHQGVGVDRETHRLSRATSGLERLVVIGHSGFITLEAMRWIRDIGASFAQIGRDGEVIAVSSAERFHNTKLRRAQALAAHTGRGLEAMRHLATAKLEQQLKRVEALPHLWPPKPNGGTGQVDVGPAIRRQLEKLASCTTLDQLRACEAVAGRWYWQTLASLSLTFAPAWRKSVPAHWNTAGARTSPPSGFKSSRKAATPFHALVNYSYAILETEATITLQAHGFDPGMGILHTDKRYRGSLAHDLMEPVRPLVDGLVIDWLGSRPLQRGDVYETREGVCRIGPTAVRALSELAVSVRPALDGHCLLMARFLLGDDPSAPPARRRSRASAGKSASRRSTPRLK